MDCQKIREIIPKYVKHNASEDEMAIVEEHLCVCQLCRDYLSGILDNKDTKTVALKEQSIKKDTKTKKISIIELISLLISLGVLAFFLFLLFKRNI